MRKGIIFLIGTEFNHLSAFWDILPTFADIMGVDVKSTDGLSLLPTLTGQGEQREHDHIYFEFLEMNGKQAVRKGKWKLLFLDIRRGGYYELYNLAADPAENHNVAQLYPEIVRELKEILIQEHRADLLWPLY
jgi:arylsulfatase A-like enzyme